MENSFGIKIFENEQFGQVRVIEEDGRVLFCGKDCAAALKYSDTTSAVKQHCREDGVVIRHLTDSLGRKQEAKFITEGNLYRLIARSQLPSAEKFERWVFDEVLVSVRKSGGYIAGQEKMTDDELVAAALLVAQRRIEERDKRIEDLTVEKNALVSGVLHWRDSSVLNAIIRRMASYIYHNDFSRAWQLSSKSCIISTLLD